MLKNYQADVCLTSADGSTPLMWACLGSNVLYHSLNTRARARTHTICHQILAIGVMKY